MNVCFLLFLGLGFVVGALVCLLLCLLGLVFVGLFRVGVLINLLFVAGLLMVIVGLLLSYLPGFYFVLYDLVVITWFPEWFSYLFVRVCC